MIDIFGMIGGGMLAVCGFPQMVKTIKIGKADDLAWSFLGMWGLGEVFMLAYILPKGDWILITNYAVNLAFLLPILYYKFFPRG